MNHLFSALSRVILLGLLLHIPVLQSAGQEPGGAVTQTQTYDCNGNLTCDGTRKFKWDAFNRLREVTTMSDELIEKYIYAADGRRAATIPGPAACASVGTGYSYDNRRVIEESDHGTTTPRTQTVHGNYIDEVVARDENKDSDGTCVGPADNRLLLLQTDTHSLAALYRPGVGIVEAYEFGPYGPEARLTDGNSDSVVNFDGTDSRTVFDPIAPGGAFATLFGGHPVDAETGQIECRERMYSALAGRFTSRDPIGGSAGRFSISGGSSPNTSSRSADPLGPVGAYATTIPGPRGRGSREHTRANTPFADSMNLYQYVRSNPIAHVDPYGLMPLSEWNKCCRDTQIAYSQLAHLRTAAMAIDGYDYGSVWRGEIGCGWCAMNMLGFLSTSPMERPQCWDYDWYSARKWLIGSGWLQLPDIPFQHQFVALRKNIDGLRVFDKYNQDSPVFDGWGGLAGNIRGKCRFSEGTVGAYMQEWISLTWRIEPEGEFVGWY